MENNNKDRSTKYLDNLIGFLNKTTEVSEILSSRLEETDYKIMQTFKPYISAQKNIGVLLDFYDQYLGVLKNVEEAEEEEEEGVQSLEKLAEKGVMEQIKRLEESRDSLGEFSTVNIAKSLIERINKLIGVLLQNVKKCIFAELEALPKVGERVNEFVEFLLLRTDPKEFLGQYSKMAYTKMGFVCSEKNFDSIIQQTGNLTKYLNFVVDINRKALGVVHSRNINVGLITMIVLDLKRVISDSLGVVNVDSSPAHIPFLICLCRNLKHSDGPLIREIEELFVFRKEIFRLIVNCFAQFFADVELIEKPRRSCRAEKFCELMASIFAAFKECEGVKRAWVDAHGPSYGIYKTPELESNFAKKCLIRVRELSNCIDGIPKYVYLINNLYVFTKYLDTAAREELKKEISKNCKVIAGLWRINIESAGTENTGNFFEKELTKESKYYLPSDPRKLVLGQLESIIEGFISSHSFTGNIGSIRAKLENAYSGKE